MHPRSLDKSISRRRNAAQNWLQPQLSRSALPAQPFSSSPDCMPAHLVIMLMKIISNTLKTLMRFLFLIIVILTF